MAAANVRADRGMDHPERGRMIAGLKRRGGGSWPTRRLVSKNTGRDGSAGQALRVSSWRPVAGGRSQAWTASRAATAPAFFSASLSSHSMLMAPE